jgi:hypothetical protein
MATAGEQGLDDGVDHGGLLEGAGAGAAPAPDRG